MARIQYSAGDGGAYQPLPEGTYDLRIVDVVQGNSKAGNPQIQLKTEVIDGPHTGKKCSIWYSLLAQSTWKLDMLLEALGIEQEDTGRVDAKGKPILDFDTDWLLDRTIQFDVTQREYNGRTNNDFSNERQSPFDAEGAPVDAPVVTAPEPQAQTQGSAPPNTMRRRPRPQR